MGKIKDLRGQRFGRLTVIKFVCVENKNSVWECRCDCGNICNASACHLKNGHTQSCGCLHRERTSAARAIHKMTRTRIYSIWYEMKRRCFNKKRSNYERYGGRGITVYDEWRENFQAFYEYVSKLEHYGEEGYSLDRIDNNGNYEPGNLRWATAKEQGRNRRSNVLVTYRGKQMTLMDAAEQSGVPYTALIQRYNNGWSEKNLFAPVNQSIAFENLEE